MLQIQELLHRYHRKSILLVSILFPECLETKSKTMNPATCYFYYYSCQTLNAHFNSKVKKHNLPNISSENFSTKIVKELQQFLHPSSARLLPVSVWIADMFF